jgi:transposase
MMIIGVDYHPSFQQIAFFVEETGECGEQELNHSDGQAERFYRDLQQRGIRVRVGMEATGYSRRSSACWQSYGSKYGWAIPRRLRRSA